jgi:predicted RNA methylase
MNIDQIMQDVQTEFGSGGLVDGLCGDFAREVAKRVIAVERDECAIVCQTPINVDGTNFVACRFAKAIRARA